MPPKVKITKEMIIDAAFEIALNSTGPDESGNDDSGMPPMPGMGGGMPPMM